MGDAFKVYPGLRDKPEFAQILADYDRVSELLGDAQHDLQATAAERDKLAKELAEVRAALAECNASRPIFDELERLAERVVALARADENERYAVVVREGHWDEVVAERDAALAENERLDAAVITASKLMEAAHADRRVAEQKLHAAVAALRRYGRHTGACLKSIGKGHCYAEHCGLDAALEAVGGGA